MKKLLRTKLAYDATYKSGYDKSYPSIELVRLEKIFFKEKGKILDFGCGPGLNGLHFLKKKYNVTFCDISGEALKKVKQKLKKSRVKSNFKIVNFSKNKKFFKKKTSYFDYIICFSVFNNFGNKNNAVKYIKFFNKILKKEGKLIIDSNLKNKHNYKLINKNKNLYTTHPKNNFILEMFFPSKDKFIEIIKKNGFEINDIGRAMFKIFDTFP